MKTITQTFQNKLTALGLTACAALGLLGTAAPVVRAQSGTQVTLDPGTVIPVKLNTQLSSNGSQSGDTFTARVDDSKQAYRSIMSGATVDGVVRQATPRDGDNPGTLTLAFTRLRLSDGRTFSISGGPTSLASKDLETRSDGVLVAKNSKKNNSLTYAGIGAGAAVLADVLRGGKLKIGDILIGGGLGYAAGALLKGRQQVHDVTLKPGTAMGVLLDSRTRYYHRATRAMTTVRRTHATRRSVRHY